MIYLLLGSNSYRALKKIADIKSAFYKKGGENLAVVELNGSDSSLETIIESIGSGNLFSARRLVVLKNVVDEHPRLMDFIKENEKTLVAQNDIFIFWERDLSDNKECLSWFKKNSEKIEAVDFRSQSELERWFEKEASLKGIKTTAGQRKLLVENQFISENESSEWALLQELEKIDLGTNIETTKNRRPAEPAQNLIFSFVDKVFGNKFSRALPAFCQSKYDGIDEQDLFRMFLWKLKNIFIVKNGESKKLNSYVAQKTSAYATIFNDKNVLDAFWEGILTDSALKRDSKNTDEHIESFIFSMKDKTKIAQH